MTPVHNLTSRMSDPQCIVGPGSYQTKVASGSNSEFTKLDKTRALPILWHRDWRRRVEHPLWWGVRTVQIKRLDKQLISSRPGKRRLGYRQLSVNRKIGTQIRKHLTRLFASFHEAALQGNYLNQEPHKAWPRDQPQNGHARTQHISKQRGTYIMAGAPHI